MTSSCMQFLALEIDLQDLEFCQEREGNIISLGSGGFGQVTNRPRHQSVGP